MRTSAVKRRTMAMLVALAITTTPAFAQGAPSEAQVKAAFVYNFLKFVEWPSGAFGSTRDSLVVGIMGTSETADAAATFLAGKQVNNRPLAVRRLAPDAPILGVHVVFIGESQDGWQLQALYEAASSNVLSIGEGRGFAHRGGVIGLLVENQKVRFEINPDAAEAAELRISSKLLALAKVVRGVKREQAP